MRLQRLYRVEDRRSTPFIPVYITIPKERIVAQTLTDAAEILQITVNLISVQ
jgi:hypothetical protein